MESALPRRYRLIRRLGRGGQGTVWLAADRFHGGSRVALKLLRWEREEAPGEEELSGEFLTLSRLAHPHIARVRDFGLLPGGRGAYFTREYVRGKHLLQWAEGVAERERWRALGEVAAQALSVLQYLATRKVRHGDVKPANLLLEESSYEGGNGDETGIELKVIDFGAAAHLNAGTRGAALLGTRAYLPSPELLGESPGSIHADLYGLGISLYHAAVGHLPFAVGDEDALEAWWRARAPARPREADPAIPAHLDLLVERLTAVRGEDRFRSPREALEFLRGRIHLPRPPRRSPEEAVSLAGREDFLDGLARTLASASRPRSVPVITGPRGSGKTEALLALEPRLQVRGFRTVAFCGPEDISALRRLSRLVEEMGGRITGGPDSRDAAALAEAVRALPVVVLLDDDGPSAPGAGDGSGSAESDGRTAAFLRALAAAVVRRGGRPPRALLVIATAAPGAIRRTLSLKEGDLEAHPLEALGAEAVSDLVRERFAADDVPDGLARRIVEESQGLPARIRAALDCIAALGASADLLGHLQVPADLPARLVPPAEDRDEVEDLPPELRRAVGLLAAAGEALDPPSAAFRFPPWSAEAWRARLEALRARGLVRRMDAETESPGSDEPLYAVTGPVRALGPVSFLGAAGEVEVRRSLAPRLLEAVRSPARPEAGTLSALALNALALGETSVALRHGLRAARIFSRTGRDAEAADLLGTISAATPEGSRGSLLLGLRVAGALIQAGELRAARSLLDRESRGAPRWFVRARHRLRAWLAERMGDEPLAILELESIAAEDTAALEARARLAPLYFRSGRTREGREALLAGRAILARSRGETECPAGAEWSRALGLFAAAEAAHGEVDRAFEMLEEALRLARASAREDLAWRPIHSLGILYAQHQRWPRALEAFAEIEAFAQRRGDPIEILRAVHNQAIILYRLHDLDGAEALFRKARRIADSLGHHALSAPIWLGFAGVLRERGRLLEALRLYRRVLRISGGAGTPDESVAHNNLSEVYLMLGRLRRALFHADMAFRIARRTQRTFLLGLSLRSRGIVRAALGRTDAARKDFERALRLAERDGDTRARGEIAYHLATMAVPSADPREAVRGLRRALRLSRSARDLPHLHAGTIALLSELVPLGRGAAARRILRNAACQGALLTRGGLRAKVLELQVGPEWPQNHARVIALCREAALEGQVWDAFRALGSVLGDPALDAHARRAIREERDVLGYRLLRRAPRRHAASFRATWEHSIHEDASGPPSPRKGTADERHGAATPLVETLPLDRTRVEDFLEDARRALEARRAWLLQDPAVDARPYRVTGERGEGIEALLEKRAPAVDRARATDEVIEAHPFLLLRLPHPRAVRILSVELHPERSPSLETACRKLLEIAAPLVLALRVAELEADLKAETARLDGARNEVRRLNNLLARDRRSLETVLLSQRMELHELKEELDLARRERETVERAPVGSSPAMKEIFLRLPRLAAQDLPVLICGESGVGKDLLARWIHGLSARRERPFVAEMCNVSESLMEAELFGFVRGAFTGAVADRAGLFERARGGTIYLDEIAELPQPLQARLLRVLEEKAVRPVGSEKTVPVDFRLVSSTCRSPSDLRAGDALRRDLFYRINAEVIEVPPLRDRKEDIPLLVAEVLADDARRTGSPAPYVHPEAMERLLAHSWPGNVRELVNEIRRITVERPLEITAGVVLERSSFSVDGGARLAASVSIPAFKEERLRVERELLLRALHAHRGNASHAARALRITRRYLGKLLEKHRIPLGAMKESLATKKEKGDLRNRRPSEP